MELKKSWNSEHKWYDQLVGEKGHHYHQTIVLPGVLRLLELGASSALLDLCCGQGVLARHLPPSVRYCGLDTSKGLIAQARARATSDNSTFIHGDVTKPFPKGLGRFTHATCVLALQNVAEGEKVLQHVALHLVESGIFVCVLNHPAFRIPRHSSWEIDEAQNRQVRRVQGYLSPLSIPIQAHPGKAKSEVLWSYHHPLATYFQWLYRAGFVVEQLEEWTSDKLSTGKHAVREDRARREFPLFLALRAIRLKKP